MHTSKPDKLYFPFLLHASAQNYVCHIDTNGKVAAKVEVE